MRDELKLLKDQDGKPLEIVGSLLDISDRKALEDNLRDSQNHLLEAQKIAHLGSWNWDILSDEILWSAEVYRIFGVDSQTFSPAYKSFLDFVHPEDRECVDEAVQRAIKERSPYTIDHRIVRPDGSIRHVHEQGRVTYHQDGKPVSMVGTVLDITDRQRAEAIIQGRLDSLTRPEADTVGLSFEDLFDLDQIQKIQDAFAKATGVAALITDTNGRPITKPSNFCRLCRDIIRKTEKGLTNCMHSDAALGRGTLDGPIIQPCLSGGLWDGGASIMVGDKHIANWLIGQVRNEQQDDEKMMAYAREIGANEEAFRAALAEVNVMSQEKFSQICQALFLMAKQMSTLAYQNAQQARAIHGRDKIEEALRENDRIKSEFVKTVAHEFRTPLTAIKGFSELLLSNNQLSQEEQEQSLRYIYERSFFLSDMVADMLDIARIESGAALSLKKSLCSVTEIFRQIEPFLKAQTSHHRLDVTLAAENTLLNVDQAKIGQVLENLLSNAVKFSPADSLIQIKGAIIEKSYQISVADQGIGMTPEQMEKVFDKFYRADASDTAVSGIGLGMSIVRNIVEAHGGSIWVESELDRGTTVNFTISLDYGNGK
ncbi:hypothetical protein A7E78_06900 [Syntrophotalea acetylenivorans]|uniref:histidine kinase n=2 Tax=Syntrophotalea acetylenivorans TaxID=1842532 RepID=A0A1L3GNQ7_9BACT|nr:hypothetical protein A7E78_06900 [Syntrophotalea acetylenivorans]